LELGIDMTTARKLELVHLTTCFDVDFELYVSRLEKLLGRFDSTVMSDLKDPLDAVRRIEDMRGAHDLMLFGMQNHGALFAIDGVHRNAIRFHIGNPLIAHEMAREDIRAGLYAPLTVLVYQYEKGVRIDYDKPSSQFAQFENQKIDEVAQALDLKLRELLEDAARTP
jgi:hypothetical protein